MIRTIPGLLAIVALTSACSSESPDAAQPAHSLSERHGGASVRVQLSQKQEITVARILKDIVGKQVSVADAAGESQPMDWVFEADEPKNAEILETQASDAGATLVVQMNTGGAPGSDDANVQLSGRLRLHYEWNGRDWVLRRIENLTFRYSRRLWT